MTITLLKAAKHRVMRFQLGFPKRVQCNICHWSGRRFISDSWHPFTVCPKCGSQVRHRLLLSAVKSIEAEIGANIVQNSDVLHFAPEQVLSALMSSGAKTYVTADFLRDDVNMKLDMCAMDAIADGAFDVVIACDVLEHVPDDGKALDELSRILRPGGLAILTVPQKDGLSTTYEDPTITTEAGKLAAFGQEDHLRIYGDNFPVLLASHRFTVTTVDEKSFAADLVKRNVLFPPVLSKRPLATNFRKVFFARKPEIV